ncbi:MAG: polysaccharide biosynthesis tyrosine autokinase [Phycisphaerae bacterium]|nr:polysaccharide biosynthesis tyrosine autokinase [Phycisphaerae bacterium]
MYLEFYKLNELPFSLTSEEKFFYESPVHAEGLANIIYAVRNSKGFVVLAGDPGTGKTFLLNMMANRLGTHSIVIPISSSLRNGLQLFRDISTQLGMRLDKDTDEDTLRYEVERQIVRMANRGRLLVITIDEAQELTEGILQELRSLSVLEQSGKHAVQIVLAGEPQLLEKLKSDPKWEGIQQKVALCYQLGHLSQEDTSEYIDFRLNVASGEETQVDFAPDAREEIFKSSDGIPRVVNVLCDNALLTGFTESTHTIDAGIVKTVVEDMAFWGTPFAGGGDGEGDAVQPGVKSAKPRMTPHEILAAAQEMPVSQSATPEVSVTAIDSRIKGSELLVTQQDRGGYIAEEYRALRTNLLAVADDEKFCYVITSPEQGDGKTLTSINLAMVMLERLDYRTILVDCDLRRNNMASYFDAPDSPGLAEVLRGSASLKEVIQSTPYPNLFFVPAGKAAPAEIGELVGGPEMVDVIAELRRSNDYILIDTPPINRFPDAGMIGLAAGDALIVVQKGKTHTEAARKAVRLLHAANVHVGGFIFTSWKHTLPQMTYNV